MDLNRLNMTISCWCNWIKSSAYVSLGCVLPFFHFVHFVSIIFLEWICVASESAVTFFPPSWSHTVLSVQNIQLYVEGLGMATSMVSPRQVLLTGGSSRGGRGAKTRLLHNGQEGWRSVSVQLSGELGEKAGLHCSLLSCDYCSVTDGLSSSRC